MPKAETVSKLLSKAASLFSKAGLDTPEFDAKLLLQHASGFSNVEIITKSSEALPTEICNTFWTYVERRLKSEPVHRILGYREFYGREFLLSEETLIPRPDTETLVEAVIKQKPGSVLEIGTGSGAIAITLAAEISTLDIIATDISEGALKTASKNAQVHSVENQIMFVHADLFDGIQGRFDLIASNPPYIPSADILGLQKEVQFFDPALALDGGEDGLDFYRSLFASAPEYLRPKGQICVEIGVGQVLDVVSIAQSNGFSDVIEIKDLNQVGRVILATL